MPAPESIDDTPSIFHPRFRKFRRTTSLLIAIGAAVQLLLSAYYLSVAHAPAPHDLPVGVIVSADRQPAIRQQIEQGHRFAVTFYPDEAAQRQAIARKEVYGGVDLTTPQPKLYIASAAGTGAAAALRAAFTQVARQQTQAVVVRLQQAGQPVPIATVAQLTAPPLITDVAPLPASDSAGAAVGLLLQALALGATVASISLGRLSSTGSRSWLRGIGHVTLLVLYGLASAAVLLLVAQWFGIFPSSSWRLFGSFFLCSLAVTGSTATFVSLFGPPGALVGTLYFVLGVPISGSTLLPEFLPRGVRFVGQILPTGAGVSAIRDSLYFPNAPIAQPLMVLGLYAGIGLLATFLINALWPAWSNGRRAKLPGRPG